MSLSFASTFHEEEETLVLNYCGVGYSDTTSTKPEEVQHKIRIQEDLQGQKFTRGYLVGTSFEHCSNMLS